MIDLLGLAPWEMPFEAYVSLYLLLIPAAPLILEGQGFYARAPFSSRHAMAWALFKGCFFTTLVLVLTMYLFRMPTVARSVVIWFGFISFGLVFAKEEIAALGREHQDGARPVPSARDPRGLQRRDGSHGGRAQVKVRGGSRDCGAA